MEQIFKDILSELQQLRADYAALKAANDMSNIPADTFPVNKSSTAKNSNISNSLKEYSINLKASTPVLADYFIHECKNNNLWNV